MFHGKPRIGRKERAGFPQTSLWFEMGRCVFLELRVDGGWAWIICLSSFMLQFLIYGLCNAYATMFVAFLQEFKQGEAETAWIGSTVFGLNFFLGPLSTALCERLGCRVVALISSFFLFTALVTTSFVKDFKLLYITYGLCLGVASSLGYSTSVIVLTKYFKRHISLAIGFGMAGTGLGAMTITSAASTAITKYGWRFTLRCMSLSSLVVFVCGLTFVPLEKSAKDLEEKKKLLYLPSPQAMLKGAMESFCDRRVWENKAFVVWSIAIALIFFADFAPFIFLTRMAADIGVPRYEASLLPGYLTVAQSCGKIVFGKLADHHNVNRITLYQVTLLIQGIATTLCPIASTYWAILLYTVIFGLTDGCFALMLGLGTYDIAGPELMTRAFGCMSAVCAVPIMAGPVVTGLIYDVSGTYSVGFFVGGGLIIVGVCLLFLIPLVTTSKSTRKIEVNNEIDDKLVSSDTSKEQLLLTEKHNRISGISSTESNFPQACTSRSRPNSSSFILAFPSLALSSNFLHEVGMNESDKDLYISAVLKRIDLEIDRYEELYLIKNRPEEQSNKVMFDLAEEDTSGICLGSSSSSKSNITGDTSSLSHRSSIDYGNTQNNQKDNQQNVDHYQKHSLTSAQGKGHWPYPANSSDHVNDLVPTSYFTESEEDRSVTCDTELSFSWDCFSELMETKSEYRDDLKPVSDGYGSSNETGHLIDSQIGNCSPRSLESIHQSIRLINDISTGCPKCSCYDQELKYAETSV